MKRRKLKGTKKFRNSIGFETKRRPLKEMLAMKLSVHPRKEKRKKERQLFLLITFCPERKLSLEFFRETLKIILDAKMQKKKKKSVSFCKKEKKVGGKMK